jgi:hypothetical protein
VSDPAWEYTQGTCDVWQLAHLCNHFAEHGWDVVAVVESYAGVKVPHRVGDDTDRTYEALKPFEVLFRRPLTTDTGGESHE